MEVTSKKFRRYYVLWKMYIYFQNKSLRSFNYCMNAALGTEICATHIDKGAYCRMEKC